MGTDIYLYYDGQPKDDKVWEEGYIRASIGMLNENYILRQLFPPEVWENENPKCPNCKGEGFINYVKEQKYSWNEKNTKCEKCEKLFRLGTQYMYAEQRGKKLGSKEEAGVAHGDAVMNAFSKMGFETHNVAKEEKAESVIRHTEFCLDWLQSVFNHYKMGLEKEEAGLHPRVAISW